jgi:hypothetical protein
VLKRRAVKEPGQAEIRRGREELASVGDKGEACFSDEIDGGITQSGKGESNGTPMQMVLVLRHVPSMKDAVFAPRGHPPVGAQVGLNLSRGKCGQMSAPCDPKGSFDGLPFGLVQWTTVATNLPHEFDGGPFAPFDATVAFIHLHIGRRALLDIGLLYPFRYQVVDFTMIALD